MEFQIIMYCYESETLNDKFKVTSIILLQLTPLFKVREKRENSYNREVKEKTKVNRWEYDLDM
jgi:hypothetical protein